MIERFTWCLFVIIYLNVFIMWEARSRAMFMLQRWIVWRRALERAIETVRAVRNRFFFNISHFLHRISACLFIFFIILLQFLKKQRYEWDCFSLSTCGRVWKYSALWYTRVHYTFETFCKRKLGRYASIFDILASFTIYGSPCSRNLVPTDIELFLRATPPQLYEDVFSRPSSQTGKNSQTRNESNLVSFPISFQSFWAVSKLASDSCVFIARACVIFNLIFFRIKSVE